MRAASSVVGWIAIGLATAIATAEPAGYVVIVHPTNPTSRVSRDYLADVFLKRTTQWPNDQPIRPVDLPTRSGVRRRFVENVLGRSVGAVRIYWQQVIFSGRGLPPVELAGDAQVVEYVRGHRGAIGYVSAGTNLEGVKVLTVN